MGGRRHDASDLAGDPRGRAAAQEPQWIALRATEDHLYLADVNIEQADGLTTVRWLVAGEFGAANGVEWTETSETLDCVGRRHRAEIEIKRGAGGRSMGERAPLFRHWLAIEPGSLHDELLQMACQNRIPPRSLVADPMQTIESWRDFGPESLDQ